MVAVRNNNDPNDFENKETYEMYLETIKKQGIITNTQPMWHLFMSKHIMGMIRTWMDLVEGGTVDIKLRIPSKGIILYIEYRETLDISIMTNDGNLLIGEEAGTWLDNEMKKERENK